MKKTFQEKYGPWAIVAGGALGIGRAYVEYLLSKSLNVFILDYNEVALRQTVAELKKDYSLKIKFLVVDLGSPDLLEKLLPHATSLEIGLLIYNAAVTDIGSFYQFDLNYELNKLDVNCRGALVLTYHFGRKMVERKRGGIVLMSSGSAMAGAPYYAHYAATKAYNVTLGESLWYEFKPANVDVLSVIPGMVWSSTTQEVFDNKRVKQFGYVMEAKEVVAKAMAQLGKRPSFVPGFVNRLGFFILRILGRKVTTSFIGKNALFYFFEGKRPEIFEN